MSTSFFCISNFLGPNRIIVFYRDLGYKGSDKWKKLLYWQPLRSEYKANLICKVYSLDGDRKFGFKQQEKTINNNLQEFWMEESKFTRLNEYFREFSLRNGEIVAAIAAVLSG